MTMTAPDPTALAVPVIPKIISVDDHVVEPAHLWQTWLPEKYRAAGPTSNATESATWCTRAA